MGSATAVCIHNYLATGQTGVAVRAAYHKFSCGIHQQILLRVKIGKQRLHLLGLTRYHTRQQHVLHVGLNALQHLRVGFGLTDTLLAVGTHKLIVLCAYNYCMHTHGTMGLSVILHRHLALGVGTQIWQQTALAQLGKLTHQRVGKVQCERYQRLCLIARVAEHHALVAGALLLRHGALHSAINVFRLLMKRRQHSARVGVKLQLAAVIAYPAYHSARHLHQIHIRVRFHFAGYHHLAGGYQRFTCHLRLWVVGKKMIQ